MRWRYHLLATTFAYSHLAQKQQHYMGITEQLRNHEKFIYSVRNVRVYRSRSLFVSLAHMCFPHIYVFMHVCVSTPPLWVYPISTWHIQKRACGLLFVHLVWPIHSLQLEVLSTPRAYAMQGTQQPMELYVRTVCLAHTKKTRGA